MKPDEIETSEDHEIAMAEVDELMKLNPEVGSKSGNRLELLSSLISDYETKHFPIDKPETPKTEQQMERQDCETVCCVKELINICISDIKDRTEGRESYSFNMTAIQEQLIETRHICDMTLDNWIRTDDPIFVYGEYDD